MNFRTQLFSDPRVNENDAARKVGHKNVRNDPPDSRRNTTLNCGRVAPASRCFVLPRNDCASGHALIRPGSSRFESVPR